MENEKGKNQVALAIRKIDHMLSRNLEAHWKEKNMDELPIVHGWFLRYLYENRERDIYQKDIEKHFGFCRSSITNTMKLMEKNGYVRREEVEKDARLKKVILTEKGIRVREEITSLIEQLNEETMRGITEEELEGFFQVIDKLEANLIRQKKEGQQGKE